MLRAVVGTVYAIHRDLAARCKSFGGDELLPVLLYVVSKVRISHLVAAVVFLQEALSEKLLEGEAGYHLSALESCVSHFQALGRK